MAVGLAFVDIVGDTSRTEQQVDTDMSAVLAQVQASLSPIELQAAVDQGTERQLTQTLRNDIRAAQQAIEAIRVDARLEPDTQRRLTTDLRRTIGQTRAAIGELQVRAQVRADAAQATAQVQQAVQAAQAGVRPVDLQISAVRIRQEMERLQREVAQRDLTIRTNTRDAERNLAQVTREVERLRAAAARPVDIETRVDEDRVSRAGQALLSVRSAAAGALPAVQTLGTSLFALGSAAQGAAGVAAVLQAMAPAAALAAPAILSVGLAIGTVKLATAGFSDAVAAAFDPSDPKAYSEALKGLAPNARAVVVELHGMQPALKSLQQDAQNRVFAGFDETLRGLASTALPVFGDAIRSTADTLNAMGKSVAGGVQGLAEDGALGTALGSATRSLAAFSDIPGRIAIAFGQLAAAAGPSLEKLATKASGAIKDALDGMSSSFAEGSLQTLIEGAVSLVGDFVKVLGNFAHAIGAVFSAVDASGEDLIGVLGTVSKALADSLSAPGAQAALVDLFQAIGLLTSTALPLLELAFQALGPVLQALLPGVRTLITALGEALTPVLKALGPVLAVLGDAISKAVVAFSPLLVVAGKLIAEFLPVLTPLIQMLADVFVALAPLIQTVGDILLQVLSPILAVLPELLKPFVDLLTNLVQMYLPVFQELLTTLQPSLVELSQVFVSLAEKLAPIIARIFDLQLKISEKLMPLLPPLIDFIGKLASIFADELAKAVELIVMPALDGLSKLLSGDLSGAFQSFKDLVKGVMQETVDLFTELPQKILEAVGGLEEALYKVGSQIIQSLIDGIRSKIGSVQRELGELTNLIPDWKGPAERDRKLLTPSGKLIMQSLVTGLHSGRDMVHNELGDLTDTIGMRPGTLSPFTAASTIQPTRATSTPTVQVFIGQQELTDIVDTRVVLNNRVQSRAFTAGARS